MLLAPGTIFESFICYGGRLPFSAPKTPKPQSCERFSLRLKTLSCIKIPVGRFIDLHLVSLNASCPRIERLCSMKRSSSLKTGFFTCSCDTSVFQASCCFCLKLFAKMSIDYEVVLLSAEKQNFLSALSSSESRFACWLSRFLDLSLSSPQQLTRTPINFSNSSL